MQVKPTLPIIYNEIKDYFKLDEEGNLWNFNIKYNKWMACYLNKPGSNGYLAVMFNGTQYLQHRIVYCWYTKQDIPTDLSVDHINGDKVNNAIANLRLVTHRENGQNRSEHRNGSLLGARYNKRDKKWVAQISLTNGQQVNLGYFNSELEAHTRYMEALSLIHLTKEQIQSYFNIAQFSSEYKGVCWDKTSSKWKAYIWVNGKMKHLGLFDCEESAHQAYLNFQERRCKT